MSFSQLLQKLHSSKLEYLLPLPLLLIAFGFGGESLTNLILSRSYTTTTVDKLQADTYTVMINFAANVLITEAEIDSEQEFATVELYTTSSMLKRLIFKVPATELTKVKAIVAQELGLFNNIEILQPNTQIQVHPQVKVLGVLAEIEKKRGLTKITVNTANSVLRELEFEFPVTELNSVKAMIIQELGLSRESVRMLVSYRIKN